MSLILDLPAELETELVTEAARLGLSLSEYTLRLIAGERSRRASLPRPLQSGAELLSYWQEEGLVGSRSEIENSQVHARRLREQASRRQHP